MSSEVMSGEVMSGEVLSGEVLSGSPKFSWKSSEKNNPIDNIKVITL
jgi:hypothetical protein